MKTELRKTVDKLDKEEWLEVRNISNRSYKENISIVEYSTLNNNQLEFLKLTINYDIKKWRVLRDLVDDQKHVSNSFMTKATELFFKNPNWGSNCYFDKFEIREDTINFTKKDGLHLSPSLVFTINADKTTTFYKYVNLNQNQLEDINCFFNDLI